MKATLVHATPNLEATLVKIARVSSNPSAAPRPDQDLIRYLIRNQHWSPFEMVNICIHIETTRDIARQILRHRSFYFQEFSQRYQDASLLGDLVMSDARLQHSTNRQASTPTDDPAIRASWTRAQRNVASVSLAAYNEALKRGIAKEVARKLLPEGMTRSSLYMHGTLRSWIHYCSLRRGNGTQLEHQRVAQACWDIVTELSPATASALEDY